MISWWWRVTKEWVVVLNYEKCTKNGPNRTKYGVDSDTPSDNFQSLYETNGISGQL